VDPREVVIGERIAVGGFAEVFVGRYQVWSQSVRVGGYGEYAALCLRRGASTGGFNAGQCLPSRQQAARLLVA
jgi:hypothetical protein